MVTAMAWRSSLGGLMLVVPLCVLRMNACAAGQAACLKPRREYLRVDTRDVIGNHQASQGLSRKVRDKECFNGGFTMLGRGT